MASIGSLTFQTWRGVPQGQAPEVAAITRPGVNGALLLVGAYHPQEQEVETIIVTTSALASAAWGAANAMVGTVVSSTDPYGTTWNRTAVLSVRHEQLTPTTAGWMLRTRWRLLLDNV